MTDYSPMDIARFWSKAEVGGPSACWLWRGARSGNGGYGNFFVGGRYASAHRVAYEIFHGLSVGDAWVCHHCDNKPCVNPMHVYLGDIHTNTADAKERDSFIVASRDHHGEMNPNHKLRAPQVAQIKRMVIDGMSNVAIGRMFGVTDSMISRIRLGKSWEHIPPAEILDFTTIREARAG